MLRIGKDIETESRLKVKLAALSHGELRTIANGLVFYLGMMKMVWNYRAKMVAQHFKYTKNH